ncbi:MAG: carboxymuconolactone decarboxylase family protein [Nocardioides sp.]
MNAHIQYAGPDQERLNVRQSSPELFGAYARLEQAVHQAVDPTLYELIKIRSSQLNGCAFCLDMHSKDARSQGETEQRLYLLSAWREAPIYTRQECAALALTEAVTRIADAHVPDDVWEEAALAFTQQELAAVLMAIVTINGWNRIAITSRTPTGHHQPSSAG